MKYELYRRLTLRGWQWFWRLKARNGEIFAHGEGYRNRGDAMAAIYLVQNSHSAAIVERGEGR